MILIRRKNRVAFTLVELLVVISIIALLLSILMPSLSKARSQAKGLVCLAKVRQINFALQMYAQENNGYIVPGRFHNGGDWESVNAWYSNLTPYLDLNKKHQEKIYILTTSEAKNYNSIWTDLVCPSEKKPVRYTYQGISVRTYGINMALNYTADTTFKAGYGLQDWNTGKTRKMLEIKSPSSVAAFCDTRDIEYTGAYGADLLENRGYIVDDYLPVRHSRGYNVGFVDGHSGGVEKEIIKAGIGDDISIWHAK